MRCSRCTVAGTEGKAGAACRPTPTSSDTRLLLRLQRSATGPSSPTATGTSVTRRDCIARSKATSRTRGCRSRRRAVMSPFRSASSRCFAIATNWPARLIFPSGFRRRCASRASSSSSARPTRRSPSGSTRRSRRSSASAVRTTSSPSSSTANPMPAIARGPPRPNAFPTRSGTGSDRMASSRANAPNRSPPMRARARTVPATRS